MSETTYNIKDLSNLKYISVVYTDLNGNLHEAKTEIKHIDTEIIELYFKDRKDCNIDIQQMVTIKFICEDGLYKAKSTLKKFEKIDNNIYLSILPPNALNKQQNRKYYRINLKRTCVLICTDAEGHSDAFMSKMVDVSAGGVLIYQLESMFDNEFVSIYPAAYEYFNIVLFLDLDTVLKLSARFVRQVKAEKIDRYAFEFIKMKQADIDKISKFVTKEQVEQLKAQKQSQIPNIGSL